MTLSYFKLLVRVSVLSCRVGDTTTIECAEYIAKIGNFKAAHAVKRIANIIGKYV